MHSIASDVIEDIAPPQRIDQYRYQLPTILAITDSSSVTKGMKCGGNSYICFNDPDLLIPPIYKDNSKDAFIGPKENIMTLMSYETGAQSQGKQNSFLGNNEVKSTTFMSMEMSLLPAGTTHFIQ